MQAQSQGPWTGCQRHPPKKMFAVPIFCPARHLSETLWAKWMSKVSAPILPYGPGPRVTLCHLKSQMHMLPYGPGPQCYLMSPYRPDPHVTLWARSPNLPYVTFYARSACYFMGQVPNVTLCHLICQIHMLPYGSFLLHRYF